MSDRFFHYMERETARIDSLIANCRGRRRADPMEITRLKRARHMVRNQLACWKADCGSPA